jgi:pSer/pThr/pTyr-binding forkhead associated (FHA) protein
MLLGRTEMADIPLFGDMSVQRQHARLLKQNGVITLAAEPGQAVTINNLPVAGSPLTPGDIIGIGNHRFRFSARRAQPNPIQTLPGTEPLRSSPYAQQPINMPTAMSGSLSPTTVGAIIHLAVVAGPHAGMVYPVTPGAILGRDPRCDIPLTADMQCSRQHARLLLDPMGWRIEDGGSTNGTLVNGQRVVNHPLQPGDEIAIGQSVLRIS